MRIPAIAAAALAAALVATAAGAAPAAPAVSSPKAPPAPLVFVAPTNLAPPLADFDGERLRGGILRDIGEAIAARLQREARFVAMPSKRVGEALAEGLADGVCHVLPRWISGDLVWSAPLIANGGVLVARADAPTVRTIADLAQVPVGTVIGYRYHDFERELGAAFVRADAPSSGLNMRKLAAQRNRYAIVDRLMLDWFRRTHPEVPLREDIELDRYQAQCAFSPRASVAPAKIVRAIDALLADGSIDRILARYR